MDNKSAMTQTVAWCRVDASKTSVEWLSKCLESLQLRAGETEAAPHLRCQQALKL